MHRIKVSDDFDLWFSRANRPFSIATPFNFEDFALLLIVADKTVTDEEREAVSTQIIRQGCRYAVCTGHQCSNWDDSIDLAYISSDPDFSPPEDRFVMTTWHVDEPLKDIVHFFRWNTAFDNFVAKHFLVIQLGGDADMASEMCSAIEKSFAREQ